MQVSDYGFFLKIGESMLAEDRFYQLSMNFENRSPVLLALVAACALGVGVTGTMLWTQSQTPAAVPTPAPAPAMVAPAVPPTMATEASTRPSTVGMTKAQAAVTLGNWYYDAQEWPQAMAQYRVALANGFDNPDVRTDYGNSLRFAGQPQKALEQYKIAQKQDPRHEQSLFNQGGLWAFSLHDNAKALAAWRAYLKHFPNGQSAEAAKQFIVQHEE